MENLYQQKLIERYKHPLYKGELTGLSVYKSEHAHPACGDQIAVFIHIVGDSVVRAQFTGVGCILSLATADLLMEYATGLPLEEIDALTAQTVQKLAGVHVGLTRQPCIALSLEALKQALIYARPS